MRKTCLKSVYELAKRDERVFFIGSDLGPGVLDEFRRDLPERFFMEGVSEAHVIGMAAGLALNGKLPYVNTIASFLTRRCFEQLALDLCVHNLSVRLIGNGGGGVYAPLGPTHLAVEDLSIMRALPNMTVVAPADAVEMKRFMEATLDHAGPIYIRLAKGGDRIVTADDGPFELGKASSVREGKDVLLVTTGVMLQQALEAAEVLRQRKLETGVLHMPTVKPFDAEALLEAVRQPRVVVAAEEHTIVGGLGSAVAEVLAESAFSRPKRFARLGYPDVFPDEYGSQASLMERYGLTAAAMVAKVEELIQRG